MNKISATAVLFCSIALLSGCASQLKPQARPIQVKESYSSLLDNKQQTFTVNKNLDLQSFAQVKQAAYDGDPDAQYALGYMYFYGKDGAREDQSLGKQWIERAAAQGQSQAMQAMELLKNAMQPESGNTTVDKNALNLAVASSTTSKTTKKTTSKSSSSASTSSPKTTTGTTSSSAAKTKAPTTAVKNPTSAASTSKASTSTSKASTTGKSSGSVSSKTAPTAPQTNPLTSAPAAPSAASGATTGASNTGNEAANTNSTVKTVPATTAPSTTNTSSLNATEKMLLSQPRNYYTLQLLSGDRQDGIRWFVHHYQLQKEAASYKTVRNGHPWYVLTYGVYKTGSAAEHAIKTLPLALQERKPWVKPLAEVQKEIKATG